MVNGIKEVGIILSLIFLVYGLSGFFSGIKNVDLVYNYNQFSSKLIKFTNEQLRNENASFQIESINTTDLGSDMIIRPLPAYYIMGMNQITSGLFISLISAFALGALLYEKEKKK